MWRATGTRRMCGSNSRAVCRRSTFPPPVRSSVLTLLVRCRRIIPATRFQSSIGSTTSVEVDVPLVGDRPRYSGGPEQTPEAQNGQRDEPVVHPKINSLEINQIGIRYWHTLNSCSGSEWTGPLDQVFKKRLSKAAASRVPSF